MRQHPENNKPKLYAPLSITHTSTVNFLEFYLGPPTDINIEDFNNTLADIIRNEPQVQNKNIKAYVTNSDIAERYPEVQYIVDQLIDIIKDYHQTADSTNLVFKKSSCWGGICRKGDYVEPHTHSPAFYNFVYYVKFEEGASPFVITDAGRSTITPLSGYGFIFPSWIVHEMPEHQSEHEMIFISGNIEASGSINYLQRP